MEDQQYWVLRISKLWVRRAVITATILFVLYVLSLGTICDTFTDRTRTSMMLSVSSGARQEIGEFMLAHPGKPVQMDAKALIPEGLKETSEHGEPLTIAFREITPSGEVRMFSPQLGTLLVLTPTISGGKVKWTCWGRPEKKVPANCRLKN